MTETSIHLNYKMKGKVKAKSFYFNHPKIV